MTQRTGCAFAAKRGVRNESFFMVIEPSGDSVEVLNEGFIGFDLMDRVTAQEAKEIEDFLNTHIHGVSYTKFQRG